MAGKTHLVVLEVMRKSRWPRRGVVVPAQGSGPGDGVPPFLERAQVADATVPVSWSSYLRRRLGVLLVLVVIKEKAVMPVRLTTGTVRGDDGGEPATRADVRGEAAGADAVLRTDERLHAAHGVMDLATHLVTAHQRLQPHQPAQSAQGSPRLNISTMSLCFSFKLARRIFGIFFCLRRIRYHFNFQ